MCIGWNKYAFQTGTAFKSPPANFRHTIRERYALLTPTASDKICCKKTKNNKKYFYCDSLSLF